MHRINLFLQLQEALMKFPGILQPLLEACNVDTDTKKDAAAIRFHEQIKKHFGVHIQYGYVLWASLHTVWHWRNLICLNFARSSKMYVNAQRLHVVKSEWWKRMSLIYLLYQSTLVYPSRTKYGNKQDFLFSTCLYFTECHPHWSS